MGRTINKRKASKRAVVVIVDGQDEKIYLEQVKCYYCSSKPELRSIKITPELPEKKKKKNIKELFDYLNKKLQEEYTDVILMLDFDGPLNSQNEFEQFKKYYGKYKLVKENKLPTKDIRGYKWMENIKLIINSPCLEYWFLLHFAPSNITKFYQTYKPELEKDVKKLPNFKDYDKSEDFYQKNPDIFTRLGGMPNLTNARKFKDYQKFELSSCKTRGVSEMAELFDFFDEL